MYLADEEGYGI